MDNKLLMSDDEKQMVNELKEKGPIDNKKQGAITFDLL